jgi:pimeloyl-ACP methyl ester carboxylesterase
VGSPMIAFGRSLGGAVAISLAERFPTLVAGVIVENTFLSIDAMVDHLMPAVAWLKGLVLRMHWDSFKKIATLSQPIMFISGE